MALAASDNNGGSGVDAIIVSASGAQTIPATTTLGASTSITLTAEGGTTVTYQARDRAGNFEPLRTFVVKIDKTPPDLSCAVTPALRSPPNHKLVPVKVGIGLKDALSGPAGFTLVAAISNEPDNGGGDGDFPNDVRGFILGTADSDGQLRAERSGQGGGRVYAFEYHGLDVAGNLAACTTLVTVPHNQER